MKRVLALILFVFVAGFTTNLQAGTCTVTNSSGDDTDGSLYFHVLNSDDDCDIINFASGITRINLTVGFDLEDNRQIIGNVNSDGTPKVRIVATGIRSPHMIRLMGARSSTQPSIKNVELTFANHTALVFDASARGHKILNVRVTGSDVGIDVRRSQTTPASLFSGVVAEDNDTGVLFSAGANNNLIDGLTVTGNDIGLVVASNDNTISNVTAEENLVIGLELTGDDNIVTDSVFSDNANDDGTVAEGLVVDGGLRNEITESSFSGNEGIGIRLKNGGNATMRAPSNITAIYSGSTPSSYGLLGFVSAGTTRLDIYTADADDQEGETYELELSDAGVFLEDDDADGIKPFAATINSSALPLSSVIVVTAVDANGNTSQFSPSADLAVNKLTGTPASCFASTWFIDAFETNNSNPWAELNAEGESFESLDPDHDCVLDLDDGDDTPPPVEIPSCADDICASVDESVLVYQNCMTTCNERFDCVTTATGGQDQNHNNIPDTCDFDSDADGKKDFRLDNCPYIANPRQENNDADGLGDICDDDDDNDGLTDIEEAAAGTDPRNPDSDGDRYCDGTGEGYGSRLCTPNDNCPMKYDAQQRDSDHDLVGDVCDKEKYDACIPADSDDDGYEEWSDSDGDKIDNCPFIYNADQADTDGDLAGDACDADDDNDGLKDDAENSMPWVLKDARTLGKMDFRHPDSDADEYCDGQGPGFGTVCTKSSVDSCPVVALTFVDWRFLIILDIDNDGIGTQCDMDYRTTLGTVDSDFDGVSDSQDNCPSRYNQVRSASRMQSDKDNDDIGDVCDLDADGNGKADYLQIARSEAVSLCTGGDADGDTIRDEKDNCPLTPNTDQLDTDKDAIGDLCDDDIDGDGIINTSDNCVMVVNADQIDSDLDTIGNKCDETPFLPSETAEPGAPLYDFQGGGGKGQTGAHCSLATGNPFDLGTLIGFLALFAVLPLFWNKMKIKIKLKNLELD